MFFIAYPTCHLPTSIAEFSFNSNYFLPYKNFLTTFITHISVIRAAIGIFKLFSLKNLLTFAEFAETFYLIFRRHDFNFYELFLTLVLRHISNEMSCKLYKIFKFNDIPMSWLVLAIITLLCWGVWGLLMKLASNHLMWYQIFVITTITSAITAILLYIIYKPALPISSPGLLYALMAGILGSISLITFFIALSLERASLIIPLTALYPAITVILAMIVLKEQLTLYQLVGVTMAIIAVLLISLESA